MEELDIIEGDRVVGIIVLDANARGVVVAVVALVVSVGATNIFAP